MTLTKQTLKGRTALITGASGTIGAAIAAKFADQGANIALQFNTNKPIELIESIQNSNQTAIAIQADLHDPDFARHLISNTKNELSTPDILINCAADQSVEMLETLTPQTFNNTIQANLNAAFALSREFANSLNATDSQTAVIVNISSIEATRPAPGHGHYATSKAAVEMLTKSMALEYGKSIGLRVNAIAPGLVERDNIQTQWPQGVASWQAACPLSRMAKAEDIANAALFLVSPQAAFITGTTLTVDGGMSIVPAW